DLGIFSPRSDWEIAGSTYPAGSLVVGDFASFLRGEPELTMLFEPTPTSSLADMTITRNTVVLSILDDVIHRLEVHTRDAHGAWVRRDLYPELRGSLGVAAVDSDENDEIWVTATDFIEPTTLLLGDLADVPDGGDPDGPEPITSRRARPGRGPALRHQRRRHPGALLRDLREGRRGQGHRWSRPDPAVRLRRLRDLLDPRLPGSDRQGVAGARRNLCAGQHPRRRRVRAPLAPGGAEGEPAPRLRGLLLRRPRPHRARCHRPRPPGGAR